MQMQKTYDCLIIGAGAAGLSAALALGRVSRSCALFYHGNHRNHGIEHVHAVLGCDHTHPSTVYGRGRKEVERYRNTEFVETTITEIARMDSGTFVAKDAKGVSWPGRSVVVATGVRDVFPDLEGYAENWPNNIYQCLFCDGWERRELRKGVLCYPDFQPMLVQIALMAHFMAPPTKDHEHAQIPKIMQSQVTLYTNGKLDTEANPTVSAALETCAANGIQVDTRKVVKLSKHSEKGGLWVHLLDEDDTISIEHVGFLFHKPPTKLVTPHLFSQLGIELDSKERVRVTPPFQSTDVAGVFVAGDASTEMTHVTNAMLTGTSSGAGAAHYCDKLDSEAALKAWRLDRNTSQG